MSYFKEVLVNPYFNHKNFQNLSLGIETSHNFFNTVDILDIFAYMYILQSDGFS